MALSPLQARFIAEYLKCRDGQSAAIAAGYSVNGAKVQASRQLRKPEVRAALRKADASVVERVNRVNHLQEKVNQEGISNAEVSVTRTIKETAKLAYYDHPDITPETRYANKVPALRLLSGQLGMIHSPGPAPMLGPIFSINIHTSPRGAEECRRDHRPGSASNTRPAEVDASANGSVVDESIHYGPEVILTPERKRE